MHPKTGNNLLGVVVPSGLKKRSEWHRIDRVRPRDCLGTAQDNVLHTPARYKIIFADPRSLAN